MTSSSVAVVLITSDANAVVIEKRYPLSTTVGELKAKLELISGALADSMTLHVLRVDDDSRVTTLDHNDRLLASYVTVGDNRLRVHVSDPALKSRPFDDLSQVKKFELSDDLYEKRSDSVLAFKMRNKLGRFSDNSSADNTDNTGDENVDHIVVGDRCEVSVKGMPKRRARVMFVGNTHFKPGVWVGVQYDEPFGKNDGSIDGHQYFQCPNKYGSFIRPNDITVGDFPEENMDFEEI